MQKRIIFAVVLSVLIILGSLGIISYLSVRDGISVTMENHLTTARIIANHIDYVLEQNITKLYDLSLAGGIDFGDDDWLPEEKALRGAYNYSIFTAGVSILDESGKVLLTYPYKEKADISLLDAALVKKALAEDRPIVTGIKPLGSKLASVLFVLVQLKDRDGRIVGVAGGEIDPTNYTLTKIIQSIRMEPETTIELVDGFGLILASTDPRRILSGSDHNRFIAGLIRQKKSVVGTCHRCHGDDRAKKERTIDMMAFAPLSFAPWGIVVREPQESVMAPVRKLEKGFFILGVVSILVALFLAVGLGRSIVRPIQGLIAAARRIGAGNLAYPVEVSSSDEIGTLGRGFDDMRVKLAQSLESIQTQNIDLERRVAERTSQLQRSRQKLSELLAAVLGAQEEERLRVARELHDDTSQSLNVILMSMDSVGQSLKEGDPLKAQLRKLREQCLGTLSGIHGLIRDLRPPVLDDLGLESAVNWIMERHLKEKGIHSTLDTQGNSREVLDGRSGEGRNMELILFRIVQEAIINIARHAGAKNVTMVMKFDRTAITIRMEDDGRGFDVSEALESARQGRSRGYGIQGMRERIALLDGKLDIRSTPGAGTRIDISVPVAGRAPGTAPPG